MLTWLKQETNVWFEITNLLIPTLNDDPGEIRELSDWILEHLGPEIPLHFTAFHPDFKLQDKPRTPPETLHAARKIALDAGLHYVYEGNIHSDAAHTYCPGCGRCSSGDRGTKFWRIRLHDGACPSCGRGIPGRWTNSHGGGSAAAMQAGEKIAGKYETLNL